MYADRKRTDYIMLIIFNFFISFIVFWKPCLSQMLTIRLIAQNCQIKFNIRELHCDMKTFFKLKTVGDSQENLEDFQRIYKNLNFQDHERNKLIFMCHTYNKTIMEQVCEVNFGNFVHVTPSKLACSIDVDQPKMKDLSQVAPLCEVIQLIPNKPIYSFNIKWYIIQKDHDHSAKFLDIIVAIVSISAIIMPRSKMINRHVISFICLILCYWCIISLQELEISLWTSANDLTKYGQNTSLSITFLVVWIIWNVLIAPRCYIGRNLLFDPAAKVFNFIINDLIYKNYPLTNFIFPSITQAGKTESSSFRTEIMIEIFDFIIQFGLILSLIICHSL